MVDRDDSVEVLQLVSDLTSRLVRDPDRLEVLKSLLAAYDAWNQVASQAPSSPAPPLRLVR